MSESSVPVPRPSEPLPCPFCGSKAVMNTTGAGCTNTECDAHLANVYLRTWNRRSPSVPTATQEQRDAGVAEATYWRDKAKHMAALMAMAGATLCEPVSTANIRDAKKSCDLGVHVMREIIDDEKRVSSSEEAANSDTIRLSAFVAELHANAPSGMTCPKEPHVGGGHLHAEDDDSPYLVDGMWYCGRCHYACNAITHRCDNPRTA